MQVSQLLLISMYLSPPKYLPRSPNAISTVRSAHDGRHPFSFWTLFLLCVLRFDLFHNFCLRWCKTFTTFPIMNRTCNALTNKHTLLLLFLVTESQIKIIPQFTSLTVHTQSTALNFLVSQVQAIGFSLATWSRRTWQTARNCANCRQSIWSFWMWILEDSVGVPATIICRGMECNLWFVHIVELYEEFPVSIVWKCLRWAWFEDPAYVQSLQLTNRLLNKITDSIIPTHISLVAQQISYTYSIVKSKSRMNLTWTSSKYQISSTYWLSVDTKTVDILSSQWRQWSV